MGHKRGFTLIELLVAVAIIALLLALVLPQLAGSIGLARDAECKAQLRDMAAELNAWTESYNGGEYPEGPVREIIRWCPEDQEQDGAWRSDLVLGSYEYLAWRGGFAWEPIALYRDWRPLHEGRQNLVYGDGSAR